MSGITFFHSFVQSCFWVQSECVKGQMVRSRDIKGQTSQFYSEYISSDVKFHFQRSSNHSLHRFLGFIWDVKFRKTVFPIFHSTMHQQPSILTFLPAKWRLLCAKRLFKSFFRSGLVTCQKLMRLHVQTNILSGALWSVDLSCSCYIMLNIDSWSFC